VVLPPERKKEKSKKINPFDPTQGLMLSGVEVSKKRAAKNIRKLVLSLAKDLS
jgi:hypothetical protein